MERNGRAMFAITAAATLAVVVSGVIAVGAEGDTNSDFVASNELFELTLPAGWVAEEHADGGGVSVTGPDGALNMNLTFIPNAVLQSGGVNAAAPAGSGPMAITEGLVWLLTPSDGMQPADPALVLLADGSEAVEVTAAGAEVDGALFILEPEPGVTAIVSVAAPPGDYEAGREAVIDALGSLQIAGGAEALGEVLDPPPLVDIAIG